MATSPDLRPLSISLGSPSLTTGGSETVTVTVKNQGTAAAGSTYTMIRLSKNATSSVPGVDPELAVFTPGLAAGASTTVTATLTPTSTGTWYAHAYVDNYNAVSQDTSNDKINSSSFTVTASVQTKPDLRPLSISLGSPSLTSGGTETVTVTVKNEGNASAGSTYTMIRLSKDPTSSVPGVDPELAVFTPGLAAGASTTVTATLTPTSTGTWYAHAYVDNYNSVSQDTSNDKINSSSFTVTASVQTKPDLRPLSISLSNPSLTSGSAETVTVTVKNEGNASAGSTYTMIRLSKDPTSSVPGVDPELAVLTPGLAAGASTTVTATLTPTSTGTWYAHAYVDNYDDVSQDVGNDKINSTSFTVTAAVQTKPDLRPLSISLGSPSLTTGGSETVTVTVKNEGNAPAGPTYTMIRLSKNATSSVPGVDPELAVLTPGLAAGASTTVTATLTPTSTGTWYAHAYVDNYNDVSQDVSNDKINSSSFAVSAPVPTDQEPDNPATANSFLTLEQLKSGKIDGAGKDGLPGDNDFYKVTLKAGHTYTFSANANVSNTDTLDQVFIRIYGPGGVKLNPDLSKGGQSTPQVTTPVIPADGDYYFGISADGTSSTWKTKTGDYTLLVHDNGLATVAPTSTPDVLRKFTDPTPGSITAADIVQAALDYANAGARWHTTNCTGLVWAIAQSAGARFFDNVAPVPAFGQPVSNNAYYVPHKDGRSNGPDVDWDKWETRYIGPDWTSHVQEGDLVRIYYSTDPNRLNANEDSFDPSNQKTAWSHSFVVTRKDASGNWLVVDNTTDPDNPSASNQIGDLITVTEHRFDPAKSFGNLALHPQIAYVSRLIDTAAPSPSPDTKLDNTYTDGVLSTSTSVPGTIDAEPMPGSNAPSDGKSGLIDKDWYAVTLDKGKIYTFSGDGSGISTGSLAISLYNQDKIQVHAVVDQAHPSFTFDTRYQTSPTQTYYLAASAGGSDPAWRTATGNYSLNLDVQDGSTVDRIRATIGTDQEIVPGSTRPGTIDPVDVDGGSDGDYYRVTLTGGRKYSFIANAGINSNDTLDSVVIRLRDSSGAVVANKSDAGTNPSLDFPVPGTGSQTYYLEIRASAAQSNNSQADQKTGAYEITVKDDGPVAPAVVTDTNRLGVEALTPSGPIVAGFDSAAYPGDDVMEWLSPSGHHTNLQWVGYYLTPAPSQGHALGWMGHRALLASQGWKIAPIYVGQQTNIDPDLGNDSFIEDSANTPSEQGRIDADQALAYLSDPSGSNPDGQGFSPGTTVYLDIESGKAYVEGNTRLLAYIRAWCEEIAKKGYKPGVYSPYSSAPAIQAALADEPFTVSFWVANVNGYGFNEPSKFEVNGTTFPFPDPSNDNKFRGSGFANATAWQYRGVAIDPDSEGVIHPSTTFDLASLGPELVALLKKDGKPSSFPIDLDSFRVDPSATIASDSPQDSHITGDNGLLRIDGSTQNTGTNLLIGAQGNNGFIANGYSGEIQGTFSQFSQLLFNGGAYVDFVKLQPLKAAGISDDTAFFNGNDGEDTLDGSDADTSIVAVGGSGSDHLTGGASDDTFTGDAGDDVIDGGGGINTAIYTANFADDILSRVGSALTIADQRAGSPDGIDTLTNIQLLQFGDGSQYVIGNVSGLTVGPGVSQFVASGGIASGTAAFTSGILTVLLGGAASGTINSGGLELVSGGGITISAIVGDGGVEAILSAGIASGMTISSGGMLQLFGGASVVNATFASGGILGVGSGYLASGMALAWGQMLAIESAGSALGLALGSGNVAEIRSGGTAVSMTIGDGGVDVVSSGGVDSAAILMSGGLLTLSSGGIASGTVYAGGTMVISAGGLALSGVAGSGNENIYAGGLAVGTILAANGGWQNVLAGGSASGTRLSNNGAELVFLGGATTGTQVSSGGFLLNYGSAQGTTVASGGWAYVQSGAVATATTVLGSGFEQVLAGGTTLATLLSNGAIQLTYGTASNTTVANGGVQQVFSGGAAHGTVVSSGGVLELFGGASVSGATFASGGTLAIGSGYLASGGNLATGEMLAVASAGSALNITLGSTNQASVLVSGTATALTLLDGAQLIVSAGGAASGTVYSGGTTMISAGGLAVSGSMVSGFEDVLAGGVASATTLSGGWQYVLAGGATSGTRLSGSGIELVYFGGAAAGTQLSGGFLLNYGSASGTTVGSGGWAYIESAGIGVGTTVLSGGIEQVMSSGLASGTALSGGGIQIDYGTAADTIVAGGATQYVASGGLASGTILSGGGSLIVQSGGAALATTILNGAIAGVAPGASWNGTIVSSGGMLELFGGASAIGTTFASGAILAIASGYVASSGTFGNGQIFAVAAGGSAIGMQLNSGNEALVLAGGAVTSTTVGLGALLTVSSAGIASRTVYSGGTTIIAAGGSATSGAVAFGNEDIFAGGTALSTTVNGPGGWQYVFAGGSASATQVSNNGAELVFLGGTTVGTQVSGGGFLIDYGNAIATTISAAGWGYIQSGGTATGTTVLAGGIEQVLLGGTVSGTVVSSGAFQLDYGTASGTAVASNAYQYVMGGGLATATTVATHGLQDIELGGTAIGNAIAGGGYQLVYGAASSTTLGAAAVQLVFGSAASTTIASGAIQQVLAGGAASGTLVSGGAYQFVYGTARATTLQGAADQFIFTGASAVNTTVGNGALQYIVAGGTVSGATISSGGLQYTYGNANATSVAGGLGYVFAGATATGTVIMSGGVHEVFAGGTLSGGTVSSGGTEYDLGSAIGVAVDGGILYVYGSASGTTVSNGGLFDIIAGGSAGGTTITSGGVGYVLGRASSTTISAGGADNVLGGGITSDVTVGSNGYEFVFAGGAINGATLSGGYLEIKSGGTAGSSIITFAGGGTLKLDDAAGFGTSTQIAGFGIPGSIDLADIAFGSATTLGYVGNSLSGILTVDDGVHTAQLALIGNYVTGNFHMANDGFGGTLITDPPVSSGSGVATPH